MLLAYLASIVVFSMLYYLFWKGSPDRFVVNQEVNLQPISDARSELFGATTVASHEPKRSVGGETKPIGKR